MSQRLKTLLSITLRSIDNLSSKVVIDALSAHSDLTITTPNEYDLAKNTIACYRNQGGAWRRVGRSVPECDLWIIWIDGFALNHRVMGFQDKMDYFYASQKFFQHHLDNGNVGAIYNHPEADRNTLKDFLTQLDSDHFQVIPSFILQDFDHLADIYRAMGPLVVKPFWGGQCQGVAKITDDKALLSFRQKDLSHQVAQLFYAGHEKRLWITGGKCLKACVHHGRVTPWSAYAADYRIEAHDQLSPSEVESDIFYAERMAAEVGLSYGSVDFIGDRINEVNGAGAAFVMWMPGEKEIGFDARPQLHAEMLRLLNVEDVAGVSGFT